MTEKQKQLLLDIDDCYERLMKNKTSKARENAYCTMVVLSYEDEDFISNYYKFDNSKKYYQKKVIRLNRTEQIKRVADYTCAQDTIPNYSGLYLVGQCNFNPITDEHYYWIKVGKANCISDRMSKYSTHNPMLWKQDFLRTSGLSMDIKEQECHKILKMYAIEKGCGSREWFRVSREDYLRICEKGFDFFLTK